MGDKPRIAIEAALRFGWDKWIGADSAFIGLDGFGASAPKNDLYEHFGITKNVIIEAVKDTLG